MEQFGEGAKDVSQRQEVMELLERISKRLWIVLVGALLIAGVLGHAAGASAGQYHVYACRTPAGESAPADGWSGSKIGAFSRVEDTCSQPNGALVAALGDEPARTANTDIATWAFSTPAGETIAGATLWRSGDTDGGAAINASYQFWLAGPKEPQLFDECLYALGCAGKGGSGQPLLAENRVVVPIANLGPALYASASCGGVAEYKCPEGKGDSNGNAAIVNLYAADITLEQNAGPSAGAVSGELTSAPTVRGASDVAFSATDPGSGVYEAVFDVDGRVVQSTVLDSNGGRCRDVGQTSDGSAAFLYVQPCVASVSADVPFDTTKVSNGGHHLIVSVIDAAGNAAPVLDRNITIENPPPPGTPNGTNASTHATLAVGWQRTKKDSLTSSFGRAQTLSGRLTSSAGTPIAGAQIEVRATPAYAGAKQVQMASPLTAADGRFSVRVAPGVSSRTLQFAYRSHFGDALPAATRSLTLKVHASIALGVTPRTASVGRSIFFRGRLRGQPIPAAGKQLVLEARSAGSGWIEFNVIRTDRRGRYHASYRFKFAGPARYQFRVRSEAESDYPFAAGSSNVVGVHER
jgi:hypothetical protein